MKHSQDRLNDNIEIEAISFRAHSKLSMQWIRIREQKKNLFFFLPQNLFSVLMLMLLEHYNKDTQQKAQVTIITISKLYNTHWTSIKKKQQQQQNWKEKNSSQIKNKKMKNWRENIFFLLRDSHVTCLEISRRALPITIGERKREKISTQGT